MARKGGARGESLCYYWAVFKDEQELASTSSRTSEESAQCEVVKDLHRGAIFKGSDIRLSTGSLLDPSVWPRQAAEVKRWRWKVVVSYRRGGEHINSLELYAVLVSLRWRFRAAANIGKRAVHFVDSQVVQGVLVKGRSSSRLLMRTLRSANALLQCACCFMVYGYTKTGENPADAPSRWGERP